LRLNLYDLISTLLSVKWPCLPSALPHFFRLDFIFSGLSDIQACPSQTNLNSGVLQLSPPRPPSPSPPNPFPDRHLSIIGSHILIDLFSFPIPTLKPFGPPTFINRLLQFLPPFFCFPGLLLLIRCTSSFYHAT